MNSLVKTVPYQKVYKPKEHGILFYIVKGVFAIFIPITYLVHYKEELDKKQFEINALIEENNRKNYLLDKKEKACRQLRQQQEEDKTVMEHNKKVVIVGNRAQLTETKTYDGNINNINNWLGGNYND